MTYSKCDFIRRGFASRRGAGVVTRVLPGSEVGRLTAITSMGIIAVRTLLNRE